MKATTGSGVFFGVFGDGLAVPVVDLLDVAEHNLVFSSHVLWNPSDLQPGHEALRQNMFITVIWTEPSLS